MRTMVHIAQPDHIQQRYRDEPRLLRVATTTVDHVTASKGSSRGTCSRIMRI
jgi:hypothetical protein